MKRSDIARLASQVIAQFEADSKLQCFDDPGGATRMLEGIAKRVFDLEVQEDPTLQAPALGELNPGLGTISVRPGLEPGVKAFTIAHEIGHAKCHPGQVLSDTDNTINDEVGLTQGDDGIFQGYDESSRRELEANIFAAELLAPAAKIREIVAADPNWSVESLASFFGVSRSAMVGQLSAAFLPGDWRGENQEDNKPVPPLDCKQLEAVTVKTPALVLAGPGAGKTRILVDRFVSLVKDGAVPGSMLALTFTNKAAGEMLDRISSQLDTGSQGLSISTFHSFGLEILKLYGQHLGLPSHPKLLASAELYSFLRDHLGKLPLGSYEDIRRPTRNLKLLISAVSRAKDELVSPAEYQALAEAWLTQVNGNPAASSDEKKKAGKALDVAKFYGAYQCLLAEHGKADYGDLIWNTVHLLSKEGVGDEIRGRYVHLLVDETQDINFATAEMLRLLDAGRGIIWAVGDPRQSIYRFRGASSVSLLRFSTDFPGTTIVELEKNYRSNDDLVSFSQAFEIPKRDAGDDLPIPKLSSGLNKDVPAPAILMCEGPSEDAELAWIAMYLAERASNGAELEDFAVLCRTRAQAQKVAEALVKGKVPNNWAGSLDKRDAFKEVMAALYLAADDPIGLTRFWSGSELDLRTLMRGRKLLRTYSLSKLLYEAADGKIEGLSEEGVGLATELKKLVGALRALDTAGQVVERFVFDLSAWSRNLIVSSPKSSSTARATLGQVLGMAKAFSRANPGPKAKAKEFLKFVRTAQEAGELKELGAESQPGLVNVATMHASKGLEWPTVIIPFVAKSKLPPPKRQPEYVPPPGLIHGEDPQDADIELACLFYVALTRPKDSLVLTYASHYGKPTKGGTLNAGLSSLIGQPMIVAPKKKGVARIQAPAVDVEIPGEAASLGHQFEGAIPYSALKAYAKCPKRFELQHILQMHDSERGYLDFRSCIQEVSAWLAEEQVEGRPASDSAAVAKFEEVWRSKQSEHWYEKRFLETGAKIVLSNLEAIRSGKVDERQTLEVSIDGQVVSLSVDSVQDSPTGIVITKVNHGPPAKAHLDEEEQRLLAHVASSKGSQNRPRITYPLHGHEATVETTDRKIQNSLTDVAKDVQSMLSGPYPPKPDMMNCRGCFAALICPANPEDDDE
jgi:superfamily I DNA/RNA helicase/CRISPR/Cas system-associated exonuclease Cas4 (RecB family)